MAIQLGTSPKPLWALAANVILNHRSRFDTSDSHTLSSLNRAAMLVWNRLKADGSPPLKRRMAEIQDKVVKDRSGSGFAGEQKAKLLEKHVTELFRKLKRSFELHKTDTIPAEASTYLHLLEGRALMKVWEECFVHEFAFQGTPPESIEEAAAWLVDSKNGEQLKRVSHLDISDLKLSAIFPQIGLLIGLQKLNLDGCDLCFLPGSMRLLTELTSLSLRDNAFSEVPESLVFLTKLSELYLDDNQLEEVAHLRSMTSLTRLSLRKTNLSTLPSSLSALALLRILDVSDNQLEAFPLVTERFTELRTLWIGGNQIAEIPDFMSKLVKLKRLGLESNKIKELPDSLSALIALEELHVENNLLAEIPDYISRLQRLTDLNMENNEFVVIPDSIGELSQLLSLNLGGSRIARIPDCIGRLTQLQDLYLDDNLIELIPPPLGGLVRLKTLDFSFNMMVTLPPTLIRLTSLTSLQLGSNNIRQIPGFLRSLPRLKHLGLTSENPMLFIAEQMAPLSVEKMFSLSEGFRSYKCSTAFSQFCQALLLTEQIDRNLFAQLRPKDKELIFEMVGKVCDRDPQWGKEHAFDDLDVFFHAVKKAITARFERLSKEKKKAVFRTIGFQQGSDKSWGKRHAFDNVLRLMDAIE